MVVQSIAGLAVFSLIAWCISENRSQVRFKSVIIGLVIQMSLGLVFLRVPVFREFFLVLNKAVLCSDIWVAGNFLLMRDFPGRASYWLSGPFRSFF